MDVKDIELYSELVDNAAIRMPGRKILGSVIQGDTLFLLHAELMDVLEEHKHAPGSDLFYRIFRLAKGLENRLEHYIQICKDNNIELPFAIECSTQDYEDLLI